MKKIIGIILLVLCCQVEASAIEPTAKSETTLKNTEGVSGKRRNKAPRRKKGFLWGLFKKKSSCNCPKH